MSKAKKFVKKLEPKIEKPKMKSISIRVSEEVHQQYEELKLLIKNNNRKINADVNGCFSSSVEKDIKEMTEAVKLTLQQEASSESKSDTEVA